MKGQGSSFLLNLVKNRFCNKVYGNRLYIAKDKFFIAFWCKPSRDTPSQVSNIERRVAM